jgi:hypothetical protein
VISSKILKRDEGYICNIMKQLVEYTLQDGSKVLVEAEVSEESPLVKVARETEPGEIVRITDKTFENALDRVEPAAEVILDKLRSLKAQPNLVEVAFGIAMDLKAGWFISAGTKANFDVTLTWKQ